MGSVVDLSGNSFGLWRVIKRVENDKHNKARWLCVCSCGAEKVVSANNLVSGRSNNCGCVRREKTVTRSTSHGKSKTKLYRTWAKMKERTTNENVPAFKNYGGRGIVVCDEWLEDFRSFYVWALANGYDENLTIDRIDNNGPYSPNNCRWTTMKQQNNNRRSNHILAMGEVSHTIAEWEAITGINKSAIWDRINKLGWSVEKALTTKVR